ncbi:gamma-glutamylcyclotransferase [Escherichia coli]|uniref:gamma-glutamylcyclotransferase n=1 Tax=Escherichia coli TaxID=562 RepID=UPI0030F384FD
MITRESLLDGPEKLFGPLSEGQYQTDSELKTSLCAAIKTRPAGQPFRVFAYGSLLWNPVIHIVASQPGVLKEWRRAFCMTLTAGRGSPERPGRMLALLPGTGAEGLIYELAEDGLEDELMLLWKREMRTTGYEPRWVETVCEDGTTVSCLTFVMCCTDHTYNSDYDSEDVVNTIAQARGPLGSNAKYLEMLWKSLQKHALKDHYIQQLAHRVMAVSREPI